MTFWWDLTTALWLRWSFKVLNTLCCVVHHSLLVLLLIEWLVQDMGEGFLEYVLISWDCELTAACRQQSRVCHGGRPWIVAVAALLLLQECEVNHCWWRLVV